MTLDELSPSAQDYLKKIWDLREWGDTSIQPSDLANKAGVKPSTVSGAVNRLVASGFARHNPYGDIELTERGERYAVAMVRRHRLLETFLVSTLGYSWDEVHTEADSLEHAASDVMFDRIDNLLHHPERDPHGDPIPRKDGSIPKRLGTPLSDAPEGVTVRIERVSDEDPGLLRYLDEQGIGIGSLVSIGERTPYADTTVVIPQSSTNKGSTDKRSGGTPVSLNTAAATKILVSPVTRRRDHR